MGGDVECIIEFRNERTGKDFKRENSKRVETEMGKTKASHRNNEPRKHFDSMVVLANFGAWAISQIGFRGRKNFQYSCPHICSVC